MAQPMHQPERTAGSTAWGDLLGQVDNLTTTKPEAIPQLLAERMFAQGSRIRLLTLQAGARKVVKDIPLPTGRTDRTVVLALEEEGTISLNVENEAALIGEDLSKLETITDSEDEAGDFDDPETDDFISAQDIANELGVNKTTITRRIKDNGILGYKGFKVDWLIPRAQFKDRDVIPGIAEMIELFDDNHQATWFFLSSNFFYGTAHPRPIDRLQALKRSDKAGLKACLNELELVKNSQDHGAHF